MSWTRNRKPKPDNEIAQELRGFERRLRGWTVSGLGAPDLHSLLIRAANEIDRLSSKEAGQ